MLKAIDVSSHQQTDLTSLIQTYAPDFVIAKLYLPIGGELPLQNHTRLQAQSVLNNGLPLGGYVWSYGTVSATDTVNWAIDLGRSVGINYEYPPKHPTDVLWLDCETYVVNGQVLDPGPNREWLAEAIIAAAALDVQVGIYTASWWWNHPAYMNGSTEFSNLPLWAAQYNSDPFLSFGGWDSAVGIQRTSVGVDQNEFNWPSAHIPDLEVEIRRIAAGLRIWADLGRKREFVTSTVGMGEPWQFSDPFSQRQADEMESYSAQLEELIASVNTIVPKEIESLSGTQIDELTAVSDIIASYPAMFDRIVSSVRQQGFGFDDPLHSRLSEELSSLAQRLREIPFM